MYTERSISSINVGVLGKQQKAVTRTHCRHKLYNHYFPWFDHKHGEVVTVKPTKNKRGNKYAGPLKKRQKIRVNCTALKTKQEKRAEAMQKLDLT